MIRFSDFVTGSSVICKENGDKADKIWTLYLEPFDLLLVESVIQDDVVAGAVAVLEGRSHRLKKRKAWINHTKYIEAFMHRSFYASKLKALRKKYNVLKLKCVVIKTRQS